MSEGVAITGISIVTGASRGLGAVIARRLAASGHPVAVVYRSGAEAARRVVADVHSAGGIAQAFAADVTDEAAVTNLVADVTDQLGPVASLVINATGPQHDVHPAALTWQDHLAQLLFFVKSPTLLMQAVLPTMRERGGGRIIQIGSDVLERSVPEMAAYTAAKAAQHSLTKSWAQALGPFGITVNTVAPGWIPVERHAGVDRETLAAYAAEVPLGRMGRPEDVAAAVAFLVSPDAGFITGERIKVNGGIAIS
ncbi:SDR family oxidoreductase [Actinacidiphila glaucinigra]|uniref:3-oxoacyl-[acyl-carrier protein] reductase n=1 Tax=Actinacidiphila glaucinigra TaxID=235986 RepID=A0A239JS05_9ACTN|nr:SDR family oxidoreductase [Actinacidiphila glaucinigra]SNT08123.1 3-oxoacyl-[acyl-carrier protein] reductase [Actinacidiphila glaucinigra]